MRVPLDWLRDYVDLDMAPDLLAERLTLLGFEVKGLERWGSDWRNVVVGELLTVERHPRADRLSLTTVRVGSGDALQIVCGATNIAPGQRVPVALPGALLPGNRSIERTEKMGIVSNGMLCSGDELRLSVDGEGILILPAGTPIGASLTDLYGDWVLDVDVKPNRGDALCLVGAGLTEVVTPALVPASQASALGWPVAAANGIADEGAVEGETIAVTNPLSERHAVLRPGVVASLLDVLALNERHGRGDLAIFEVGKGYARAADGAPAEWWRLALLLAGASGPAAWNRPSRPFDLDDAKGVVEILADALGLPDVQYETYAVGAPLHPGRAARTRIAVGKPSAPQTTFRQRCIP